MEKREFESLTSEEVFRKSVTNQFTAAGMRLSSQDVAIGEVKTEVAENTKLTQQIAEDTKSMRSAWADGVATKRFFCRLTLRRGISAAC